MNKFFNSLKGKCFFAMICLTVISLVLAILDGVLGWKVTFNPIFTFVLTTVFCASVVLLVNGIIAKYTWHAFVGFVLLILSVVIFMIGRVIYWGIILTALASTLLAVFFSLFYFGNKASASDDEKPEYKNYKERQLEKDQLAKEKDEKEPNPEIKSFN